MSKIYYFSLFLNECELLEITLNQYWNLVDYFVIAEADHTFTGFKKHFVLDRNIKLFEKYKSKLIHLKFVECSIPDLGHVWAQEKRLRDCMLLELEKQIQDDDVIIYSDIDEIVSKIDFIIALRGLLTSKKPQVLKCINRMYFFDLEHPNKDKIYGPYFIYQKDVKSIQDAREARAEYNIPTDNCGWHFQNLGGTNQLLAECAATSHLEDSRFLEMQKIELEKQINSGNDLKGSIYTKVNLDSSNFPEYVWANRQKFDYLFSSNEP